jgi:hypothetical protein
MSVAERIDALQHKKRTSKRSRTEKRKGRKLAQNKHSKQTLLLTASQSLIAPSFAADTNNDPSGENRTILMAPKC